MKLIREISEKDVGGGFEERFDKPYQLRKAARAVLFNEKGEIAFQHISNCGYYKLPGGGVDQGESIEEALHREIAEEVGCKNEIVREVGIIIEYRNELDILHISYCYQTKLVGELGETSLEQEEIKDGLKPLWVLPDDAIRLLKSSEPTTYDGKFIVMRDLAFLEEAIVT